MILKKNELAGGIRKNRLVIKVNQFITCPYRRPAAPVAG